MTIGLILYELFSSIRGLELEPNWKNSVLTYQNASQSDIPVMVIFITLGLGIVGFVLLRKFRFPWLFIGIVVMLLGSVLAVWYDKFPIMNVLEILLIVSLLITKQFQVRKKQGEDRF
ncbi:hypothetical protein CUC15_01405 [Oceanobacillus zhaokaii]|uniref:Uncharacterized protein n=1 Tax=Oceanobacillus zhaokaii TaxID=2052660 RepID=A0A345PCI9_9BACI|nr:hypothetical protein [Oceanobacillus zhaokaii]AXI07719.1 hypothetical protein CUC15_01405 [Oceanobacillus zhaokaii]